MKLNYRYKEKFSRTLQVIQGRAVGFQIDEVVIPGGKIARREFLTHPGAVGTLAFDRDGKILMVKQYRYPVREFTLEIPAGKLAAGEDPLVCVKRELEEETGFIAKKTRKLLTFWPTAAFSDETIHLYVSTELVQAKAHPDEDEFLEIVRVSPAELQKWIGLGRVHDAKTLIAFLAWRSFSTEPRKRRSREHPTTGERGAFA